MPETRVAITGLGIISPFAGTGLTETWTSLAEGKSAIGPIELVDTARLRFQNGAEVRGYHPDQHFKGGQADLMDRFAQFAVIAGRQALQDSGLTITPELSPRTAIVTGSCVGGQSTQESGLPVRLPEEHKPGPSFNHSSHHGQRWSEPSLHGAWDSRPCFHCLDRMFVGQPAGNWAGVPGWCAADRRNSRLPEEVKPLSVSGC